MAIGFDAALQVERALALPPCDAESRPIEPPTLAADAGLYVMFTSGTTGVPKGSLISHHAVGRLVDDQPFFSSARPLSMLHAAPLAFDASTLEIWAPLLTGGTISCWEGDGADLVGISDRIARDNVTAAWLTSALFQAAVDGVPTLFDPLEIVLTGGDVVSAEHVRRLQERKPELVIINGYGPTENTVFTTCEVIGPGMKRGISQLSIGRPIRGTTVRIVDEAGERVPKGRVGELLAGGWGVAMPSDGSDRDGQFMVLDGERWYRTGDRARWCADGRLEFHGRADGQVKIGGHRVEFTAVEAALRRCPEVTDACVTTIGEGARRRLVAAVAGNEAMVTAAVARQFARGVLSPAEVPSTIVAVAVIPATENGKADRRAVAALVGRAPEVALTSGRDDELLSIVLDVVKECLGRELASAEQPLSEAGIDSIDLVRISLALGERLARPVELGDVLEGGSAEGISDRLRVEMAREAERLVVLRQTEEGSGPSLYCVPGVGGTVFSFGALLDSIDANIGVFGLPYPGVVGPEEPLDTVDTLAARCAARIAEGRPADVIVGYSLGGFVAFETARLVLEQTGVAPEVVVIDSAPAALPLWKGEGASRALRRELKLRLEAVLPPGVVAMMRGRGKAVTLEAMRRVVAAGFKAFNRYDPSSAPLDVTLLRTTRTDFDSAGAIADLGWSHLAARTRVVEIEGTHLEVFRGTTALEIGRALSARCAYAGRLDQRPRRAFRKSSGD
jgi:thioesterase domain-containing protein/acyl carrier protein